MKSESSRFYTPLLAFLLMACMVRLWLPLLPESFWIDETVTAFVIRHGANHPSLAVGPRLEQTIYYWLPRLWQALFGFSEVTLRLPSLAATLVSLWLIGRVAARLIHPQAAWVAVFLCFIPHEFTRQATDARPYGLGTCVALAGIWFLIRWLDTGNRSDAAFFSVFAGLLVRVHLIYWPFYAVLAGYALVRRLRSETSVSWPELSGVFAFIAVSLAPLIAPTLALSREARSHVVMEPPTVANILGGFQFAVILGAGLAVWLVARGRGWRREPQHISFSDVLLLVGWWLWQPVCLLVASWATGSSVFLPRYFSLALPGMMLTCTMAIGYSVRTRAWKPVAALLAVGILIVGIWKTPFPPTRNSHWREAALEVNRQVGGSPMPVICPSPFVEALPPAWSSAYPLPGFLYAHMDAYPIHGATFLFPARLGPEGQRYALEVFRYRAAATRRFLVYGGTFGVSLWTDWFARQPELGNWHNRQIGSFGDVEIVMFEANGS